MGGLRLQPTCAENSKRPASGSNPKGDRRKSGRTSDLRPAGGSSTGSPHGSPESRSTAHGPTPGPHPNPLRARTRTRSGPAPGPASGPTRGPHRARTRTHTGPAPGPHRTDSPRPLGGELALIQLGVKAALGQQLVVGALLHDAAFVHHQHDVRVSD